MILSAITVVSFSSVNAIGNILVPYLITGNIQEIIANPESLNDPINQLALGLIVSILFIIMVIIGAYWLYRFFGEHYYGVRGAIRWALFGVFFAILMMALDWLFPAGWRLLINVLKFCSVFVTFFIARMIIPIKNGAVGRPGH